MKIRVFGIDPLSGQPAGEGEVFEGETAEEILTAMKNATLFGKEMGLDTYRQRLVSVLACGNRCPIETMFSQGLALPEKEKPKP